MVTARRLSRYVLPASALAFCLLLSLPTSPGMAAPRPSGDSYWTNNGAVLKDSALIMFVRIQGKKMCLYEPMGYYFVGTRSKGNAYRGDVHGPQWTTPQKVTMRFERINGSQAMIVKSRGRQSFGPNTYYRVARSEIVKSRFARQPTSVLDAICK